MQHLDLFSGIGGFALAASWVWPDHTVAAFCEKDEWCRRILQKHWPDAPIIEDIRDLDGSRYANVDLLTGGFPCQPFSNAGQQRGTTDDRHLWPQMLRVIRETRPRYVVAENVGGLVSMAEPTSPFNVVHRTLTRTTEADDYTAILSRQEELLLARFCDDLEASGYVVQPLLIPAAGVDAPHQRDRVWIVAHADGTGPPERPGERSHARAQQPTAERTGLPQRRNGQPQPGLGRGDDGLPARLDPYAGGWPLGEWERGIPRVASGVPDRTNRLKALGNAIVPQVAARIFEALRDAD